MSFFSSCLPSAINQPKVILKNDIANCLNSKLQQVQPTEVLVTNKDYYLVDNPSGMTDTTVTKIMFQQVNPNDQSSGKIFKAKGWFSGGKRKSHIRKRKSRHSRKHHIKTRKHHRKK
jgi:hypothetical protein